MFGFRQATLCVVALIALILLALILVCSRGQAHHAHARGGAADGYEEGFEGGGGFRLRMRDPSYTYALEGKKTVEARPNKPPFNKLKAGETITVARSRPQGDTAEYEGVRRFAARVDRVTPHASFKALVDAEGLSAVAPGAKNAAAATAAFREFTDEAAEKEHGLLAIAFARVPEPRA
jgi:ASC-1-like (ASCH) protein